MPSKCPIRVAVPVNLRPYFHSITTKNFFVMVSAEFHPTKETYTFAEVAEIVKESPVSYTHLDVYKRQDMYSLQFLLQL